MIELPQITTERKYQNAEMLKEEGLLIRSYAMSIILRSQEIQDAFSMAGVSDENILDFDLK